MGRRIEIAFACTDCGRESVAGADGLARCRSCGSGRQIEVPPLAEAGGPVEACPVCGNGLLYVQRDFNQKVGLAVVILGGALAPFTPFYASLFVAAAVDAGLYALLPDVTVCYKCHAHLRGFARNPRHQAFDLHLAEQYDPPPPPAA